MDAAGHDRVALFDNALIPPAGERWTHVRAARAAAADAGGWFGNWGKRDESRADAEADEDPKSSFGTTTSQSRVERSSKTQSAADDEYDELPWQLIAVLSEDMLAQLARQQRRHDNLVNRALNCHPPTPPRGAFVVVETSPPEAALAEAARVTRAAETHAAEEDHDAAAEAYAAAMQEAGFPPERNDPSSSSATVAAWTRSYLSFRRGASLRRAGRLDASARALRDALATAPNFADALFESALRSLDAGKFSDAFETLERLACADRAFPDLQRWMTRALAREKRGEARAAERARERARAVRRAELETRLVGGATRFCRAWRQTGSCAADGERERHARRAPRVRARRRALLRGVLRNRVARRDAESRGPGARHGDASVSGVASSPSGGRGRRRRVFERQRVCCRDARGRRGGVATPRARGGKRRPRRGCARPGYALGRRRG